MPDMKNSERVWSEPALPQDDYGYSTIGPVPGVERIVDLTKEQLTMLSVALGENVRTAEELIRAVQKMSAIRVHNVEIVLEPGLLNRLKSRCLVPNFSVWLRDEVLRWAHNEVGW